jgi:DNA-binding PadR family transcriptional regulator
MAARRKVSNLLALAILAQLSTGRAMHPYEIASVLKQTGKEGDMRIKWGSFYTVVQNLEKHGFIEATTSSRDGRRPERTVYAITHDGLAELQDWLRELVERPEPETNRFEAALSVLSVLPPDEAIVLLRRRVRALGEIVADNRAQLASVPDNLPRIFLIEAEYAQAMREAEAVWIQSLLDELAAGTLSGAEGWRRFHETGELPPEYVAMLEPEVTADQPAKRRATR